MSMSESFCVRQRLSNEVGSVDKSTMIEPSSWFELQDLEPTLYQTLLADQLLSARRKEKRGSNCHNRATSVERGLKVCVSPETEK
jgi:hypothetical protein